MKLRCLETCFQTQSVYIFNRVIGKSPRHRKNCPYGLCFNYFTCTYAMINYNVLYVVELLSGFGLRDDSSVKSTVLLFEVLLLFFKSSAFPIFETLTCFLKNLSIYNFFFPSFCSAWGYLCEMTACIFTFGNLILFSLQNVGRKVVFSLTFSIHFENVGSFNHFFSKYFRFTVLRVCYRVLFFTALIDFIEIVPFFVKKMQICSKMYSGSALFVLYRPLPINFRASNMPNYIILHFQSNIHLSNHRHYNTFCSLNFIYTNSAKKHFRSIHTKIKGNGLNYFQFLYKSGCSWKHWQNKLATIISMSFNVMPKAERFLNKFQSTKNIRF